MKLPRGVALLSAFLLSFTTYLIPLYRPESGWSFLGSVWSGLDEMSVFSVAWVAATLLLHSLAFLLFYSGMNVMPGIVARRLSLTSCLTTAYSISANAAAALLDAGSPITNTADWPGDIVIQGAWELDPRIVDHQDPSIGVSHIRVERDKAPQRRGSLSRAVRRWSSLRYWHVWMIKRRSVRIS